MEVGKILWPNDFSYCSREIISKVHALVGKFGAELHLLHVAPDLSDYGSYWGKPNPKHVEAMHAFALRGAKKKLAEFCQDELSACPAYQIHVRLGDPANEILESIDVLGIDLVIMGVKSQPGNRSLGTVVERVGIHSRVPVIIINPDAGKH